MNKGKRFKDFIEKHEDKSQLIELKKQISNLAQERAEMKFEIGRKSPPFRCGVISCTHYGSIYEDVPLTNAIYDWYEQEGVEVVFHCGDITEGCKMRKGHSNSLHKHGFDQQAKWTIEKYPYKKNIKTYLISGNHDASHMKNGGADICNAISRERDDIVYLGTDSARFTIERPGERNIEIDIIHPDGGSSYALSYKPQKIIESIDAGQKPDLLLVGHFHKAFFLPFYRNVACVLAGCTQRQSDFMKRNGLAAHTGGHIVEMNVLDGNVITTDTWRGFRT